MLNKLSEQQNEAFKVLLQNTLSPNLQSRYSDAQNAVTLAVKMSKESIWEKFGRRLDSKYS